MTQPLLAASAATLTLFLAFAVDRAHSLVISEFLAENDQVSADEDGDFSDWIEIHNPSDEPLNLAGHGLTDDASLPHKWTFPEVSLPPGGFLIVYASGKNRQDPASPLHTNFAIDGAGEFLGLFAPDGTEALSSFTPAFPNQFRDTAFGQSGNNSADIGYLLEPTPGSLNGVVVHGFVADTQFSVRRGFYTEPIAVAISTSTEDATIYYTLDGTEPTPAQGTAYTEPIELSSTTILRALAMRDRYVSSNVDTQTYLFASDVKTQVIMDARVTEAPAYLEEIDQALGSTLPALSIVGENDRFFGNTGIYTNFDRSGRGAEVPISLEYFSPQDPEDTFNIRAGIRIHGGNARSHPKKPFRLYFREEYSGGRGELEHPLYAGSNVNSFEQLVLRSCGHDSWSLADRFGGSDFDLPAHATFLRDQFLRKTENDMGLLSPRGKYVHVYLNGNYWGIYDMHERPNDAYFSDHLGGKKEDWDVVHHPEFPNETYSIVSGNAEAWEQLQSIASGQVADSVGFERIQDLVNLDGYIDSMIVRMWSGDYDWCGPVFRGLTAGNETIFQNVTVFGNKNWYAGRRSRNGGDGKFHFFSWDAEMSMGQHLMFNLFGNTSQRAINLDLSRVNDPGSPVAPYDALITYPPFQRAFADRINKHLFNGGALTPEKTQARLKGLVEQLEVAVIAESARWGNTAPNGRVFTRDDDWRPEVDWLRDTFMVERGTKMLEGFRARDIYPEPDSPVFERPAGFLEEGATISLSTAEAGAEIYFTTDGTDPAELPQVELLEVLQPNAPCQWLVPNASNGGLSGAFRWTLVTGAPNPQFWWDGRVGIGYDAGDGNFKDVFETDVEAAQGNGVYCRVPFSIPSESALQNMDALILRMRYDDGFVAYINGVRVAAANAPAQVNARSVALGARLDEEALIEEAFDVTSAIRSRLVVGTNILAIHGLNSSDDDDDFLIAPRMELRQELSPGGVGSTAKKAGGTINLTESAVIKARTLDPFGRWSALSESFYYFETPVQPGDLAVSEIHYQPAPPRNEVELAASTSRGAFEFLELQNARASAIELEGATFTEGIRFVFPQTRLTPGERVVLVRDANAFAARYGLEHGARVAGQFARDSKLSDMGERLTLNSADGEVLLNFRYNDRSPWPESADGEGASLVYWPADDTGDPGDSLNWAASLDPDGYPGHGGFARFSDWAAHYFTADQLQQAAFEADPDGDGLTNGFEYAFGSHPGRPTETTNFLGFDERVFGETEAVEPVFFFLRRPDVEDLQFAVEFSSDLQTWETTDLSGDNLIIENNVRSRERASLLLADPLNGQGYARLRVSLAE